MKKQIAETDNQLQAFAKGKKKELKRGGRAVIYQRVSSKEQEFGYSPEMQTDICYKWAERNGYEIVKCFEGEHESAKTDANRKRFNTMLSFVKDKKNRIDAVIVYSTSRFSRTRSTRPGSPKASRTGIFCSISFSWICWRTGRPGPRRSFRMRFRCATARRWTPSLSASNAGNMRGWGFFRRKRRGALLPGGFAARCPWSRVLLFTAGFWTP